MNDKVSECIIVKCTGEWEINKARVMLDEMKKSGIITDIAETYKEFLDAYMDAGFTRKEAVEILANQGFSIKPQISDRILGNKRT